MFDFDEGCEGSHHSFKFSLVYCTIYEHTLHRLFMKAFLRCEEPVVRDLRC